MPLRMLSRFWGQLNNLDLPYWLRRPTFYLYVWMFNCRPDEVIVQDFSRYKNLSEFFRRLLKPGLRPIDKAVLTSPVDGRVLHCGRVQNGTLEQVKGVTYSLSGFLGPLNFNVVNHSNFEKLNYFGQMRKKSVRPDSSVNESDAFINGQLIEGKHKSDVIDADDDVVDNNIDDEERKAKANSSNDENEIKSVSKSDDKHLSQYNFDINNINNNKIGINSTPFKSSNMNKAPPLLCDPTMNGLFYCVIYLAPGDYHRFHSPADWFVQMRRHFPGELFSVKPSVAHWLKGLFNMNERVVYFGRWAHGFFSMSPVGATNVGSICVYIDKSLKTNVYRNNKLLIHYDKSFINNKNNDDDDKNNNSTSGKNDSNVNNTIDVKSIDPRLSQIHQQPQQPQPHQPQQPQQQKQQPQGIYLKKGKLFGEFNLGSTIVLLFEAPNNFRFAVVPGQKIQYGQAISVE
ncbi:hypothetical protein HELRODRAFT_113493 [Helobdella robusta]|uniref:phosphatidylserine decarboxylase n=1 Tax=Helobdella robusta TaxID=6412 RepID=T1EFS9_HELRO|nr:hypothetical protein HELRODRAFT_113493 [Helobdella robusta]ESO00123.1 hypothetical protein HELRODRAFT_113493 [Helobdella robusta]